LNALASVDVSERKVVKMILWETLAGPMALTSVSRKVVRRRSSE
jgi:hypothetical protein